MHRSDVGAMPPNVRVVPGDLMKRESLSALLSGASTVVNLAYMPDASRDANLLAVANLALACKAANVRRLIHLSTATVVGGALDDVITESTPPVPRDDYERTKLEMEQVLTDGARDAFQVVVLRPTAVFGPRGRNLAKLAANLHSGSGLVNYARSCLYGRRRMNLVCVENVVAAVRFAAKVHVETRAVTYIVSDDDESTNNFRDVESILRRAFGLQDYLVPTVPVPKAVLRMLLRGSGHSNTNPARLYSGVKLAQAGFEKVISVGSELALFADWYRRTYVL